MPYSETLVAAARFTFEESLELLPPLVECQEDELGDDDLYIAIAAVGNGVFCQGTLVELYGEHLAKEGSKNGLATFTNCNVTVDNYCISRFEHSKQLGRFEVSSYDIIEDSIGFSSGDRNVAGWRELDFEAEIFLVFDEYPINPEWHFFAPKMA